MLLNQLGPFLGRACRGQYATEGVGDDAFYVAFSGIVEKVDERTIRVTATIRTPGNEHADDLLIPIGQIFDIVGLP